MFLLDGAPHPTPLAPQRGVVGADQGADPFFLAGGLVLGRDVGRAHEQGRDVGVDGLVLARTAVVGLVEDAEVGVPELLGHAIVPVPSLAVDGVVGEAVQALDVAEVVDGHDRVVAGALVGRPGAAPHATKVLGPVEEPLVAVGEMGAQFLAARAEQAQRGGDAEPEEQDHDAAGCRRGAEQRTFLGGVIAGRGELRRGPVVYHTMGVGVARRRQGLQGHAADGLEEEGQSRKQSVTRRQNGEEDDLAYGAEREKLCHGDIVLQNTLLRNSRALVSLARTTQ